MRHACVESEEVTFNHLARDILMLKMLFEDQIFNHDVVLGQQTTDVALQFDELHIPGQERR